MPEVNIIQFPHPGVEAAPDVDSPNVTAWNNGPFHKRKFIKQRGAIIEKGKVQEEELVFWGEWEAQSGVKEIKNSHRRLPRYLHTPFLNPSVPDKLHNTDPNVFGKRFRYIVCKQHNSPILRTLSPGSIVLFGSSINGEFGLDTVFVISDVFMGYNSTNIQMLKDHELTSGQYFYTSVLPMYEDTNSTETDEEYNCRIRDGIEYRLYTGVTYEEREKYGGVYSFVPCKTFDSASESSYIFRQPKIELPGIISGSQTRGFKSTEVSLRESVSMWNQVKDQVENQKLNLGISFTNPPLRNRG